MGPRAKKWGDFLARLHVLSGYHPHKPAFITSKANLERDVRRPATGRKLPLPHHPLAQLVALRCGTATVPQAPAASHTNLGWLELASCRPPLLHTAAQLDIPTRRTHAMTAPKWKEDGPTWHDVAGPTTAIFTQWIRQALFSKSADSRPPENVARTTAAKRVRTSSRAPLGSPS